MALLVILALIGAAYTLLTSSPYPVRSFELAAVWGTLGMIALALLSDFEPLLSLSIAAALATPLWYVTLSISRQHAQSQALETASVWRNWQATTGAHTAGSHISEEHRAASLGALIDPVGHSARQAEVEYTQRWQALKLAPTEQPNGRRGRV